MSAVLEDLLMQSQQMLLAAKEGKWQVVFELERARAKVIDETFPMPIKNKATTVDIDAYVEKILQIDQELKELSRTEQQVITGDLKKVKQNSSAIKAYLA